MNRKTLTFFLIAAYALGALTPVILTRTAPAPVLPYAKRSTPVLVADRAWEAGVVQEPNVIHDTRWRMWYTGNWWHAAIGYAESEDGITWRKHDGPVLGLGAAGVVGSAAHFSVMVYQGIYYVFWADTTEHSPLWIAESIDGLHWTNARRIMEPGVEDTSLANTFVWIEDGRWRMLYDSKWYGGNWKIGIADGTDAYHWTKRTFPVGPLGFGGMVGGPFVERRGDKYILTYHAGPIGADLPTRIYQAESTDLVHWRELGLVLDMTLPWEVDQVADAYLVGDMLFYDGMSNVKPAGSIGLAIKEKK